MMRRAVALSLVAVLGCRSAFDWRSHVSLRAGHELRLSYIDPAELVEGAVSANLHYVAVSLESAFLRNLPGVGPGQEVALGIEVRGILPKDEGMRTVVSVERARGADGTVVFENVFATAPAVYSGRSVEVSLFLRAIPGEASAGVRGRITGAGKVAKILDPAVKTGLQVGHDLFQSIIGASSGPTPAWSYTVRLQPADSVHRDKPEMLFTAARHVLLLLPPPGAAKKLGKVRPDDLVGKVRMSGTRLVWTDGREYLDSPYIVLGVTRFRRYPNPDSPLRRAVRRMDELIEQGAYPQAQAYGRVVGREIGADKVVSVVERNLERSWLDLRYARIEAKLAADTGKHEEEMAQVLRQLERLATLRADFLEVLEPAERRDIEFRASRLLVRAKELGPKAGRSPDDLVAALRPYETKMVQAQRRDRQTEETVRTVRGQINRLQAEMLKRQEALSLDLKERSEFVPKIYKQGWFWALVGVFVAGSATTIYLSTRGTPTPEPGAPIPLPRGLTAR